MRRLILAVLVLTMCTLLVSSTASAQAVKVASLSCSTSPLGVNIDVRGLGNTNLCVVGSATVDLNCACVSNSGSCPQDAAKQTNPETVSTNQSFQPKNGRVVQTVPLPISLTDASCTQPQCGSGQNCKLIGWSTVAPTPTFTICTTTAAPGTPCSCADAPTVGDLPETINCGPQSAIVYPGKKNSCQSLFP
jgi:hypothetical protein